MRHAFPMKSSLLALAATLAVAGCNKAPSDAADNAQVSFALPELPATLPLAAGTGEPISYAPEASALPDAEPLRVGRVVNPQESYGYADAAYEYTDALGDAPPDYAFDYEDGVEPWAWQGYDNSVAFAEPIDDGYRTYYYRPGATEPYFIRDPYYSYGFADGLLSVIYAADGGIVPYADYGPRLAYASRYYARGRGLYSASRRGNRRAIHAATWRAQSPILFAARTRWAAGRAHQPAWGAYHNANLVRQQRYWREETIRRRADTQRFAEWRNNDFRTPPPPRAIPAAWNNAKWARDETKFRPAGDNVRQAVQRERQQTARQDERAATAGERQAQQRVAQRQALQQDARQDRQQARRQQARQQDRAQEQRQQRAERPQDRPQQAQREQQAERQQDRAQAQRQETRQQAQRQQAQREQQAERRQQRAQEPRQQERQQAQRQQQAERQQQRAEAQQRQRQRQQPAERVEQRKDRGAERQQAVRAEQRQQAQAAQREQRQQAQQAQRQRAQQAERAQAQAQRQQERQQARPEPRPQFERARQQPQPQAQPRPQAQQRQEVRQERQAARQEQRADRPHRQ